MKTQGEFEAAVCDGLGRFAHRSRWFHDTRHYAPAPRDADRPRLDSKLHACIRLPQIEQSIRQLISPVLKLSVPFASLLTLVIGTHATTMAVCRHWLHDTAGEHRFHFFTSLKDTALIRVVASSVEHIGGTRDQNQVFLPSRLIPDSSSLESTCLTSSLFMRRPLLAKRGKAIASAYANSGPSAAATLWKASSCVAVSCRDRNTYSDSQISSVCRIEGVTGLMRNRSMPASSHCRRCPASVRPVTAIMKQSFKRACWRTCRATSSPLMSGIMMSSSSTSGWYAAASARPVFPS